MRVRFNTSPIMLITSYLLRFILQAIWPNKQKTRWASRLLHHLVLLLEHLTKALDDLQDHQQHFKRPKREPEEGFAPFTLEFETVRGSGVRRVAGSVLHEQRFFMLLHILLLREPRNIV